VCRGGWIAGSREEGIPLTQVMFVHEEASALPALTPSWHLNNEANMWKICRNCAHFCKERPRERRHRTDSWEHTVHFNILAFVVFNAGRRPTWNSVQTLMHFLQHFLPILCWNDCAVFTHVHGQSWVDRMIATCDANSDLVPHVLFDCDPECTIRPLIESTGVLRRLQLVVKPGVRWPHEEDLSDPDGEDGEDAENEDHGNDGNEEDEEQEWPSMLRLEAAIPQKIFDIIQGLLYKL